MIRKTDKFLEKIKEIFKLPDDLNTGEEVSESLFKNILDFLNSGNANPFICSFLSQLEFQNKNNDSFWYYGDLKVNTRIIAGNFKKNNSPLPSGNTEYNKLWELLKNNSGNLKKQIESYLSSKDNFEKLILYICWFVHGKKEIFFEQIKKRPHNNIVKAVVRHKPKPKNATESSPSSESDDTQSIAAQGALENSEQKEESTSSSDVQHPEIVVNADQPLLSSQTESITTDSQHGSTEPSIGMINSIDCAPCSSETTSSFGNESSQEIISPQSVDNKTAAEATQKSEPVSEKSAAETSLTEAESQNTASDASKQPLWKKILNTYRQKHKSSRKTEIDQLKADQNKLDKEILVLKESLDEKKKENQKLREELNKETQKKVDINLLKQEFEGDQIYKAFWERINELEEKISTLTNENALKEQSLNQTTQETQSLKISVDEKKQAIKKITQELAEQIQNQDKELDGIKKQISTLKEQLNEKEQAIQKIENLNKETFNEKQIIEKLLENRKQEAENFITQISHLKALQEKTKSELQEKILLSDTLQQKLDETTQVKQKKIDELIEQLRKQPKNNDKELESQEAQLSVYENELQENEQEKESLKAKIKIQEQEIIDLTEYFTGVIKKLFNHAFNDAKSTSEIPQVTQSLTIHNHEKYKSSTENSDEPSLENTISSQPDSESEFSNNFTKEEPGERKGLVQALQDLNEENEILYLQLEDKETEINKLSKELYALQEEIAALEANQQENETEKEELKNKLLKLKNNSDQIIKEKQSVSAELDEIKQTSEQNEKEKIKLQDQLKSLNQTTKENQKTIDELIEKLDSKEKELDSLTKETSTLKNKLEETERTTQETIAALETQQREKESLKTELEKIKQAYEQQLVDKNQEEGNLRAQISDLEVLQKKNAEEKEELKGELLDLQNNSDQTTQENQKTIDELKKKLCNKEKELEPLQAQLSSLENKLKEAERTTQEKISALEALHEETQNALREQTSLFETKQQENEELKSKLLALQNNSDQTTQEKESLKAKLHEKLQEKKHLELKLKEQSEQLTLLANIDKKLVGNSQQDSTIESCCEQSSIATQNPVDCMGSNLYEVGQMPEINLSQTEDGKVFDLKNNLGQRSGSPIDLDTVSLESSNDQGFVSEGSSSTAELEGSSSEEGSRSASTDESSDESRFRTISSSSSGYDTEIESPPSPMRATVSLSEPCCVHFTAILNEKFTPYIQNVEEENLSKVELQAIAEDLTLQVLNERRNPAIRLEDHLNQLENKINNKTVLELAENKPYLTSLLFRHTFNQLLTNKPIDEALFPLVNKLKDLQAINQNSLQALLEKENCNLLIFDEFLNNSNQLLQLKDRLTTFFDQQQSDSLRLRKNVFFLWENLRASEKDGLINSVPIAIPKTSESYVVAASDLPTINAEIKKCADCIDNINEKLSQISGPLYLRILSLAQEFSISTERINSILDEIKSTKPNTNWRDFFKIRASLQKIDTLIKNKWEDYSIELSNEQLSKLILEIKLLHPEIELALRLRLEAFEQQKATLEARLFAEKAEKNAPEHTLQSLSTPGGCFVPSSFIENQNDAAHSGASLIATCNDGRLFRYLAPLASGKHWQFNQNAKPGDKKRWRVFQTNHQLLCYNEEQKALPLEVARAQILMLVSCFAPKEPESKQPTVVTIEIGAHCTDKTKANYLRVIQAYNLRETGIRILCPSLDKVNGSTLSKKQVLMIEEEKEQQSLSSCTDNPNRNNQVTRTFGR